MVSLTDYRIDCSVLRGAGCKRWGEHAYEITTTALPRQPQAQQVHQERPQQVHQQPVNAGVPPQQQAAVPPQQQAHAVPQQQQQPVVQQQPQQVPIHHEPIVEKPKDPAYGI
ncbi:hypothetical protein Y032_0741g1982 [Ancylostoma ceylanicum]|uniref:Uncharacterized protein n=1 Tax=Ancylostoma ceylanicum TaxID=53326 RepID=A0A016WEW1_9BILA|nr:hypothetical protein Y032_0741g1982 [Ancylostoma ceylanicum]